MKILLAEDEQITAQTIARSLTKAGFSVTLARDGRAALEHLRRGPFDVLLTDWTMPRMDGIALIVRVRESIRPVPYIIMITALDSSEARARALDSGADDFLSKPVRGRVVIESVRTGLARRGQSAPRARPRAAPPAIRAPARPPLVGVAIAASTGGPGALSRLLASLTLPPNAACFIVQHAPAWMLEALAARLNPCRAGPIVLARDGLRPAAGTIHLAPGDHHMILSPRAPGGLFIRLTDDPPENFVRPAADPLFRSAAAALGRYCVAVILTGMGRDGTVGAGAVCRAGGIVLAQDPAAATAPSMPRTAIDAGVVSDICPLDRLGDRVSAEADELARRLVRRKGRGRS